jgi:hypothetical protein
VGRGGFAIAESFARLRFCGEPCFVRVLGTELGLFDSILFFHGINSIYALEQILLSFNES